MAEDDCGVCNDPTLLQNAACYEKDFRWSVLQTLCYISQYLSETPPGPECTCVTDGQAVDEAFTAGLIAGTDGTNYQILSVDANGRLNVNALITPVAAGTSTQSLASVNGTVSTILVSNAARLGGWIRNIGSNTVFVRFGAGATIILPTAVYPGDVLLFGGSGPVYTGIMTAITAGTTESLEITELTA